MTFSPDLYEQNHNNNHPTPPTSGFLYATYHGDKRAIFSPFNAIIPSCAFYWLKSAI